MAQIPMDGTSPVSGAPQNAEHAPGQITSSLASWAGAVVSLGLVIGAGVWGYNLLVRDVTGVPVVRSIEGPMREQPADPGGQQAAHQGLAVNNVAAVGTAADPADRLVLAPPPIKLSNLDAPAQRSVARPDPAQTGSSTQSNEAQAGANGVDQRTASAAPSIVPPTPIQPGDVDGLLRQIAATQSPAPAPDVSSASTPVVAKEGIGTSLRPRLRPVRRAVPATLTPEDTPASQPIEVAAENLEIGTRLVQLGAFASPEIARSEWDKLQGKFGDYLGDKQRVVQKASSGGRTFYRLRAMGFADLNDARRLCSALKAENAACIPVVTR